MEDADETAFYEKVDEDSSAQDASPEDSTETAPPAWMTAVRAAQSKKAEDIRVLDLTGVTSFTDYFVICTGSNPKQVQAIADEVALELKGIGERPVSSEGYSTAEWILLDYADYIVHVFSPKAREFYDLERLWRAAKTVEIAAAEE